MKHSPLSLPHFSFREYKTIELKHAPDSTLRSHILKRTRRKRDFGVRSTYCRALHAANAQPKFPAQHPTTHFHLLMSPLRPPLSPEPVQLRKDRSIGRRNKEHNSPPSSSKLTKNKTRNVLSPVLSSHRKNCSAVRRDTRTLQLNCAAATKHIHIAFSSSPFAR